MVIALSQARMQETCLVSDQQSPDVEAMQQSSQQQYHRYNRSFSRGLRPKRFYEATRTITAMNASRCSTETSTDQGHVPAESPEYILRLFSRFSKDLSQCSSTMSDVCDVPLRHPRAKKTWFRRHTEPWYNFYHTMFRIGRGSSCNA